MTTHTLRAAPDTVRIGVFDAEFPPIMAIKSGDTVEVQCVSGRDEVLPPYGSPLIVPPELKAILAANPGTRAGHIVTGPIAVDGAMPGDMLEVQIEKIVAGANWGYNLIRPLVGTLPEDFNDTTLMHIPVDQERLVCYATVGHRTEDGAVLRRDGCRSAVGLRSHRVEGAAGAWRQPRQQGIDRRQQLVFAGVGARRQFFGG